MSDHVAQDVKAWRELLPSWQPTLGQLQALDHGPPERMVALRAVARGWGPQDARWDVLMALLVYERRQALTEAAEKQRTAVAEEVGDSEITSRQVTYLLQFTSDLIDLIDPDKEA